MKNMFVLVALCLFACGGQQVNNEPAPAPAPVVEPKVAVEVATPDPSVQSRTAEAEREAKQAAQQREEFQKDLAILESSMDYQRMADAISGKKQEVCQLIERFDAGERVLNPGGYARKLLENVNEERVRGLRRVVAIEAMKKLFDLLRNEQQGTCFEGEATLDLGDGYSLFNEMSLIYDRASLRPEDVGFGPGDVRSYVLARGRSAVEKNRRVLNSDDKGKQYEATYTIQNYLRLGFTADELGLTPSESARVIGS